MKTSKQKAAAVEYKSYQHIHFNVLLVSIFTANTNIMPTLIFRARLLVVLSPQKHELYWTWKKVKSPKKFLLSLY